MRRPGKFISVLFRFLIRNLMYVDTALYMKCYVAYLRGLGMNIDGMPKFISNDVYFDGKDYSIITIADNVTISREVMFLTHDYSMHTVHEGLSIQHRAILERRNEKDKLLMLGGISIGRNSFVGARSSLLPGTVIGENVLVGACSVVKGHVPDNCIIVGNPARVVGTVSDWLDRKLVQYDKNNPSN